MNTTRPPEWPKSGMYWHLHHDVLMEYTHDIDERWDYVVKNKPADEVPTRLRLMRPVVGELPADVDKAYAEWDKANAEWCKANAELDKAYAECYKANAEWDKARAEWCKAYAECYKANAELDKARAANLPAILALHSIECPGCPWDGETIFPRSTP